MVKAFSKTYQHKNLNNPSLSFSQTPTCHCPRASVQVTTQWRGSMLLDDEILEFSFNTSDLPLLHELGLQASNSGSSMNWPRLEKKGAGNDDVHAIACTLWLHYKEYRNRMSANNIGNVFPFDSFYIPILDKPPGYKSRIVECLEHEMLLNSNTLGMERAIFIIDHACAQSTSRDLIDRVTFAGPGSRTLHHKSFYDGEREIFMARMGADKVPDSAQVKPWRFDGVQILKEAKAEWYICVIFPYSKQKRFCKSQVL